MSTASAQDLTTQPIPRALLKLALPVFASNLLRLGYQWVDALWVRGLGVDATAAVTTSLFLMWWVLALNDIFAIGVTAYASQLIGAGERRRAGVAAYKGLRASALLGLLGTAAALIFGRKLFGLMSTDARMVATGSSYLTIVLAGAPLLMVAQTCESIMRASGDTRTPLALDVCAVGLNALLDPLLIYGIGPFPKLGVAGAAWATVIAQAVLVVGYLLVAARGNRAFPLARHADGPPIRIAGLARVGIPAAIFGAMFSVVYVAFARAASQFGPAAMAVVGIVNRIEAVQFMSAVAIGTAGAALVGQNLGAGHPERAEEVIRVGLRWAIGMAVVLTLVLAVFPATFIGLFSHDPQAMALGVPYLRVLSICLIANAMEIVTAECVMGSGHTRAISIIFTVFSLLRIPLAFLVPAWTHSGVVSIAWIITLTCIVRGLLIVGWASRGTWKRGLNSQLAAPHVGAAQVGGGGVE